MMNVLEITDEYLKKLDQELILIPLTFDYAFKSVFGNQLELLKKFILLELNLNLEEDDCSIIMLDKELPQENYKEYKKTIDIHVTLNHNIYVDIEMNRSKFHKVQLRNSLYLNKLFSLLLDKGDDVSKLKEKMIYQLNLNTEDKSIAYGEDIIVSYGIKTNSIYMDNRYTILKYLEFYRRLYYNDVKLLDEAGIWLVALTSKTFTELNEILSHVLDEKDRNSLIKEVIRMSNDKFILHEWQKDKMDALEKYEEYEAGRSEGRVEGIKENLIKTIKAMLKKNYSIKEIQEITQMSESEIAFIKETLEKEKNT